MPVMEVTDNLKDLSTDQGFQFKFRCERCGDGFIGCELTPEAQCGEFGAKKCA
jgi:hypothetical protein